MPFLAKASSVTAAGTSLMLLLALSLIIPVSRAGYRPGRPQLSHEEKRAVGGRSYVDSLGSLFGKRDACATQYGATYVDCGYDGCYQPSLGEVCCSDVSLYCLEGEFCAGNNCCPNGLTSACCILGNGCPANVSSYYASTPTSPETTSLPVSDSTSVEALTTSSEIPTSVPAETTPLTSTTEAPVTLESTSSEVAATGTTSEVGFVTTSTPFGGTPFGASSTHNGGGVSTSAAGSGAQEMRLRIGVEGVAAGVLGFVGVAAGLL